MLLVVNAPPALPGVLKEDPSKTQGCESSCQTLPPSECLTAWGDCGPGPPPTLLINVPLRCEELC